MSASQGKQPKSGRVEMPPLFLCAEAGLELRGIRFQIESLILETLLMKTKLLLVVNQVDIFTTFTMCVLKSPKKNNFKGQHATSP